MSYSCCQQLYAFILLVDFFGWLLSLLFYILRKLILPCICWLYIQLFTSNNQITEMYKCQILEVIFSTNAVWLDRIWFVWFFRNESTVPASYLSFLIILIDLWLSERKGNNVYVNQWLMNFTWILCITFHPV